MSIILAIPRASRRDHCRRVWGTETNGLATMVWAVVLAALSLAAIGRRRGPVSGGLPCRAAMDCGDGRNRRANGTVRKCRLSGHDHLLRQRRFLAQRDGTASHAECVTEVTAVSKLFGQLKEDYP